VEKMDPIYVKGLKDAKELFDSGVLNEAEFVAEKKRGGRGGR
jgi:hypothetical protein